MIPPKTEGLTLNRGLLYQGSPAAGIVVAVAIWAGTTPVLGIRFKKNSENTSAIYRNAPLVRY